MDCIDYIANPRQRVADYTAVLVLTRAAAENVDVPIARLGGIVAEFMPMMEPARLREWSGMDMAHAVRTIKIDLLRHEIARAEAPTPSHCDRKAARSGRRREPTYTQRKLSEQDIARLDEEISKSVVASFFKFMTMSAIEPDWFKPYMQDKSVY